MANKDFFLDPDEAQTMGNINYMRKSIQVRHTFPKTLKNPNGLESVKNVSSLEDNSANTVAPTTQQSSISSPSFQSSSIPKSASSSSKSAPSSNDMNIFRNMAKNLGKR
ncbi:MAG: hypothetical protein QNJ60_08150 [Xenococcaceae cyanobacterium MO_188.B19]|nr:hypothetical protein [Xenococcaceae cyanobacterium MO_188.B19]